MDTTLDDIDFITDEITAIKRKPTSKRINVKSETDVAKQNYKASKRLAQSRIKQLKRSIRAQRLAIKQAKMSYKIIKLNNKR